MSEPSRTLALYFMHDTRHNSHRFHAWPVWIEGGDKVRNVSDHDCTTYSKPSTHPLDLNSLDISVYGHDDRAEGRSIGLSWAVEYREVFAIDQERAERMARTLKLIGKRLDKLRATLGAPESFPAYVARVVSAIGAKLFVFVSKQAKPGGWGGYDEMEHQILEPAIAISKMHDMIQSWIDEKKGAAA